MGQPQPNIDLFEEQAKQFSLIPLDGKVPIQKGWQRFSHVKRQFNRHEFRGRNAGIVCGPASGIIVLDIDDVRAFQYLCEIHHWKIMDTRVIFTGSGKPHCYFAFPQNGKMEQRYGNKSLKHPVFKQHTIFDLRGVGGQVVAAGSIHPDTGKPYVVRNEGPIKPLPEWMKEFYKASKFDTSPLWHIPLPNGTAAAFIESLKISPRIKALIQEPQIKGTRSEKLMSVLKSLCGLGYDQKTIFYIFDFFPIGEKYREKGAGKQRWLQREIQSAMDHNRNTRKNHVSYLNVSSLSVIDCQTPPQLHIPYTKPLLKEKKEPDFTDVEVNELRAGRFLKTIPQPYQWLIEGSLPLNVLAFVIANGGTGKGYFALELAASVAGNIPFLNHYYTIKEHGKVFCLWGEDTDHILHHRLHAVVHSLVGGGDLAQVIQQLNENLFLQSVFGYDSRLIKNAGGNPEKTDIYEKLLKKLSKIKDLKLVIIDPISRFFAGEENDSTATTFFCTLLEKIANETGATVLVTHHTHKGTGRGQKALYQESVRGSTAFTNAARWQLNLAPLDFQDTKELGINPEDMNQYIIAKVTKKNIGRPEHYFYLKRDERGVLHHIKIMAPQRDLDQKVLESVVNKIIELERQNIRLTVYDFSNQFASVWHGYGRNRLKRLIEKAVLSGELKTISTKNVRNRTIEVLTVSQK